MEQTQLIAQFRRIRMMPAGQARVLAAEKLVKDIENSEAENLLAAGLLDLVEAYTFADDSAHALATFAKILRIYDERPAIFDEADMYNLYWEYKWIVNDALDIPSISKEQIEALIGDMERRYRLAGKDLTPVRLARFLWARHTGDPDTAEYLRAYISETGAELDDCHACKIGTQVDYFLEYEQYEDAIRIALTQRWDCNQEPWNTRTALALAAFRQGDDGLAIRAYKEALASYERDVPHSNIGQCRIVEFLALSGQVDQAVRHIEEIERKGENEPPRSKLIRYLHFVGGLTGANDPRFTELRETFVDKARKLAELFDARNGTDRYQRLLDRAIHTPHSERNLDFDAQARAIMEASRSGTALPEITGSLFTDPQENTAAPTTYTEEHPRDKDIDEAGELGDGMGAWTLAEEALSQGHFMLAGYYFQRAATIAESNGYLDRAGMALAEAAQSYNAAGETASSDIFARAVPLLIAGEASLPLIVDVLQAWAPVAYVRGDIDRVIRHLRELLDKVAPRNDDSSRSPDGEQQAHVRVTAGIKDCLARALFSSNQELSEAYRHAFEAGEIYAHANSTTDAAHALWLSGKIAVVLGNTEDAVLGYESACEGFTLAREMTEATRCGEEFLELLRSMGQEARAEELLKMLQL